MFNQSPTLTKPEQLENPAAQAESNQIQMKNHENQDHDAEADACSHDQSAEETQFTCNSIIVQSSDLFGVLDSGDAEASIDVEEEDPIALFTDLFGEQTVFLNVEYGGKKPITEGWPKLSVADMTPGFIASLTGNIGILLGAPSGGVCAIDIDNDGDAEVFLAHNPRLTSTLRSKGARGQQVWVRIVGDYPSSANFTTVEGTAIGEWRADGRQSVVYGQHPCGTPYTILSRNIPLEIAFSEIKWPAHFRLPWLEREEEWGTAPYEKNDSGEVRLQHLPFINRYLTEHTLIYESSIAAFYEYAQTSGVWKKQSEDSVKRKLLQELQAYARREKSMHFLAQLKSGLADSLVKLLQCYAEKASVFENRPKAIHVANCMLSLENGEFVPKEFSPEYFSRNICPYKYDPNSKCEKFINELLRPALSDDDILLMQKWAGSCLLGCNSAQKLLLLLGTPGGGKSTFMSVLESVIGRQNVGQLRTEHLSRPFELYNFIGKTLLTGKDVSEDFLMDRSAHVIKALIGHDYLTAEKKGHSEPIQVFGDFNIGIVCNANLNIRLQGDIDAWRRRLLVVQYEKPPVANRIVNFADKLLQEEGSGILNWMLEGALLLLDDISKLGNYELSAVQEKRIDDLLSESDSIRHFVSNCVVAETRSRVKSTDLKDAYQDFCESKGWVALPPRERDRQLPVAMQARFRTSLRHDITDGPSTFRGYVGVAIKLEGTCRA